MAGMNKISRNDPCPCGSGKKYKRCCLSKEIAPNGFDTNDRRSVIAKLEYFAEKALASEGNEAWDCFYQEWEGRLEELDENWTAASEEIFNMWFFCDCRFFEGGNVIDSFLEKGPFLSPGERQYLRLLRDATMRPYEVVDLSPGESVVLRELPNGPQIKVHERTGSRSFNRHDLLIARLILKGASGYPEIEAGLFHIPDLIRHEFLSELAKRREEFRLNRPAASDLDFYKEICPFFHNVWISSILDPYIPKLTNTDGEDLLDARIHFDVADPSKVEIAFDHAKELERNEEEKPVWHWNGINKEGKSVILGRFALQENTLEIECNSANRGERSRELIEALAIDGVCYRTTIYEDTTEEIRDSLRSKNAVKSASAQVSDDDIPRELQENLVLDAQVKHYREWLDLPIPALENHTPREASKNAGLRPKCADLIMELEGDYQRSLKDGSPAYDPSWMWIELGFADGAAPAYLPPLAHERMAEMAPDFDLLCRNAAERMRQQPGFNDSSTIMTAGDIRNIFGNQRHPIDTNRQLSITAPKESSSFERQILFIANYELHRRKTFWVDESLAYMLAKTEMDILGDELRAPFPCFAFVFTDRYTLSLAERMLSHNEQCPITGQFLKAATIYIIEERLVSSRTIHIGFALDALGADPPYFITCQAPLTENAPVKSFLDNLAPKFDTSPPVPDANPLRGLLHIVFSAMMYATSAGVDPQIRSGSKMREAEKHRQIAAAAEPVVFSSDDVFFLPGAIEISHVRKYQELERVSGGREILHRFMVRGHWRRASPGWKDQRVRWIEPYWKGPDIAAVIERTYKMKV
jgi:hypothetical protein